MPSPGEESAPGAGSYAFQPDDGTGLVREAVLRYVAAAERSQVALEGVKLLLRQLGERELEEVMADTTNLLNQIREDGGEYEVLTPEEEELVREGLEASARGEVVSAAEVWAELGL